MSKPIVSVENLGKSYLVGHNTPANERYVTLRDTVGRQIRDFGRKASDMIRGKQIVLGDEVEEFWALKDVSFELQPGEVVGIIGRNGAGKSTLLKVLSRITEQTQGRVRLRGRVASLLEVGTGFHPELTGRENIYLNGAILGMARLEIRKKFDEIVDFAGVERFLDTPVKRYSSGMYVRLAFAVAAHLEPEILIVDEVLSVGDVEFQKKCLGKMRDVGSEGRTVLLVSHNMGSISMLCKRAILLDHGSVIQDGNTSDVILSHLGSGNSALSGEAAKGQGNENGELVSAWTEGMDGNRATSFALDEEFAIVMDYRVLKELPVAPFPNFHFCDERGQPVFVTNDRDQTARFPGVYRAKCFVPGRFLNDGPYFVGVALTTTHDGVDVCFFERDALSVNIVETMSEEVSRSPRYGYGGPMPGVVRPVFEWSIEKQTSEDKTLVAM
ncbi:MAG: ABC transporter ATP-binding protein [Fuerstiella sp.]|nr:ABC transporter ATP-binding protein [Fuerstiella sp.]MCP4858862.1 ABC transporter ATP-binding protein [Fuerstiella sp.]